jgi:predicted alpha/beta-hydrolase family hydrolase
MPIEFRIPLQSGPLPSVGALLDNPSGTAAAVLLAHGAGVDMTSDFMADVATALAALDHPVLRFRYPYMERMATGESRRPPDRMPTLEACHLAAAMALAERTDQARPIFCGKSMGGRVGSHLVQAGVPCRGLAFLGYPLHPAGKRLKLRDDHFELLDVPALFLQGTRDKLAELDLLEHSLEKYAGEATLQIIDGANHGFQVLMAQKKTPLEVRSNLAVRIHAWSETL